MKRGTFSFIVAATFSVMATIIFWIVLGSFGSPRRILLPIIPMCFYYGIILNGFLHYRVARREEVRQVLLVAAESKAPLDIAIRAYLEDQSNRRGREGMVAFLLNFVTIGYYFIWHQSGSFDRRLDRLADLLEMGTPLSEALFTVRGVANQEVILAAAVGEQTGDLAGPLRLASRSAIGPSLIAALPGIVYPMLIVVVQFVVLVFLIIFIVPKFEKIMVDFKMRMPPVFEFVLTASKTMSSFGWLIVLIVMGCWISGVLLFVSPGFRWRFPVIGWFDRRLTYGRTLKMLGMLLQSGKTVPESLSLLGQTGYLSWPATRRIRLVADAVDRGQPLLDELRREGILSKQMTPFLSAAERIRNLPWAIGEAGELVIRRTLAFMNRLAQVAGPLLVVAVGGLVGVIAVAMFGPLITIISNLGR